MGSNEIVYGEEKNTEAARQPGQDKTLLYQQDKPNESTKEGPLSLVLFEYPQPSAGVLSNFSDQNYQNGAVCNQLTNGVRVPWRWQRIFLKVFLSIEGRGLYSVQATAKWSLPQSRQSARLFLQLSELGPPPPHKQTRVSLPHLVPGEGHTRLREKGWGVPIRRGQTPWYCRYICTLWSLLYRDLRRTNTTKPILLYDTLCKYWEPSPSSLSPWGGGGIGFKGTVAWDGFFTHCILSRIERKDLNFFHVELIFTGLGQDLTHLARKENTHSEIFLLGRLKI
jgi:hypothetical protein